MKNFIPLVLAVLLGLAAVLAVGRLLSARRMAAEKTALVVASARDISEGEVITDGYIMKKEIPASAVPAQAIYWTRAQMVVGQKALRNIAQSDYLLLPDVGLSRSMGNIVGEGEWAVSMALPDRTGIGRMIQPGDEVAVIGTFKIAARVKSLDAAAAEQVTEKAATLVLLPRARVLDVGGLRGGGEGGGEGGSDVVLTLPPAQAQILIAAQRQGELTLALRRPNDESNLSRIDAGMIDDESFKALLDGLKPFKLPAVPGAAVKK
ncbi:MAG: Flp pilus assembly protein CpaB [Lentisphaeria bacterium]|jgi:pilus assembly protein CpaB